MDADLDLLLTAVYVTADDLLPERQQNARRRQVAEVIREIFHIEISLGAVDAVIMRMSAVLADPWQALKDAVHEAEFLHADETSWLKAGRGQWLWVAATALLACYRIDPHRSQAAAKELIGEDFGGFLVSDRYAAYHFLDVLQQQLCYAHLIRHAVIMRKVQLGTQSEEGNRWVERILSIRETMRLQDRSVLDYLIQAATASHHRRPVPSPPPP